MQSVPIKIDRTWFSTFQNCMNQDSGWATWEQFQLAIEAAEAQTITDFSELSCLRYITDFTPLPHQIKTAQRVINEMRGRAILADEVGLGKTIEAGLVFKEYMDRGLVQNALILVPSSLVLQWTRELNQKFRIPAVAQKKAWMWDKHNILVASLDTAKRDPHREKVLAKHFDLLIVDEAHKLKNRRTKNWQFVNEIRKKYCLLLTATPVQNNLDELYNLVTLLKPGHLGRPSNFQSTYVSDKRTPKNEKELRAEIERVMIRNRRSDGQIAFTKRHVHTVPIQLSKEERQLYDGITQFIRHRYQSGPGSVKNMLSLIILQREVCSSRDAAFLTLFKLFQRNEQGKKQLSPEVEHLVQLLRNVKTNSKIEKAISLIKEIKEKVILFTEYRATQEMILRALAAEGIPAVPFRGGFQRNKKDWMMEIFQKRAQVMVATEAGGEGINLQFCRHIINYDMPWNPMRIEQRIGRVHRLGQKHDVNIYNFSTQDTIEEYILSLLHEKIDMFRMVIGEMETILERLNMKESIERNLMKIVLEAKDDEEIKERFSEFGSMVQEIKDRPNEKFRSQDVL